MKQIHHGILLKKRNYSETSLITTFYTLENGVQTYIFQGGKKKKGNQLHALSCFELETYYRQDSELGKLTAIHPDPVFSNLPFHPIKTTIVFFLAELLENCLKSSEPDKNLYHFLKQEIQWLDQTNEFTNYPVWFLAHLTNYLGCAPQNEVKTPKYIDLKEGEFLKGAPNDGFQYLGDESIPYWSEMMLQDKANALGVQLPSAIRKLLMENLLLLLM
jgi:DNA repair protein RecO (recombination protein O)